MSIKTTRAELLSATIRQLTEQGYDVVVDPSPALLPPTLKSWHPDAVAIGREPRLVVEITSEGSKTAARIATLQSLLRSEPGWKLYLVLDRVSGVPAIDRVSDLQIDELLDRSLSVADIDTDAALLMGWAALEALCRARRPDDFMRPQSPGRLVEQLASRGEVGPSDANFLRLMALQRNRFVHGDLSHAISRADVVKFINLLKALRSEQIMA